MANTNDEFEKLIESLSSDVQEELRALDDTKKQELINNHSDYVDNQEVYMYFSDLEKNFLSYYQRDNSNYGSGTNGVVSSLISYEIAQGKSADFYDPMKHFLAKNSEDKIKGDLSKLTADKLIFAKIPTIADNNDTSTECLKTVVEGVQGRDGLVVIPLSIADKERGIYHSVSLVLEPKDKKAVLVDQCGTELENGVPKKGTQYADAKTEVFKALKDLGYGLKTSEHIMTNRSDCAIFAAMINEKALEKGSIAELDKWIDEFTKKPQGEKEKEVDEANARFKNLALSKYVEQYKENPLFKKYLELVRIDISAKEDKEVLEIINKFAAADVLTVDENMRDDDRPNADPEWAKEVEEAVKRANAKTHNKFERFEDPDHPNYVCFKDSKNENNIIAFASKSNAYVAGDQAAFDELVMAAKKMGNEAIRFGKFEKHPEYKAKLYLACLKCGMAPVGDNVPTKEELEESPEYDAIKVERDRAEITKKYNETKKARDDAKSAWDSDPQHIVLEQAIEDARNAYDADQSDENKDKLEAAESRRNENPAYKAYDEARNAHIESSKKMLDLYLEHGLKPFDRTSPEERKNKADEFVKWIERDNGSKNTNSQVEQRALREHLNRRTR